jgi:hypothetical protein
MGHLFKWKLPWVALPARVIRALLGLKWCVCGEPPPSSFQWILCNE